MNLHEELGVRVYLLELARRIGKDRTKELLDAVTNRCRLAGVGDMGGWLAQWELELAASASPVEVDAASTSLVVAIAAVKEHLHGREEAGRGAGREGAGREAREARAAGADARPHGQRPAQGGEAGLGDLPREALMEHARATLAASPPGTMVWFKFTCERCGERCVLAEPNTLHERGECIACGHETEIVAGGMMLAMMLDGPPRPTDRGRPN